MRNDSVLKYSPGYPFRFSHINTIYPALFRHPAMLSFNRVRTNTPDKDFLDVDIASNGNQKSVFLFHGLEGSSASKYIHGMGGIFYENGWDVIAMNYRGCSGEMNRQAGSYHSGRTDDVAFVLDKFGSPYDRVAMIGFSLGGNLILKYLGEDQERVSPNIQSAVAISVPLDLNGSARTIGKLYNRAYEIRFLKSLKNKIRGKHKYLSSQIDLSNLNRVGSIYDFDEYFTAPLHGYKGAENYYRQCSGKYFIRDIQIPTLVLTAADDPFFDNSCYPYELFEGHPHAAFEVPDLGGHVGFADWGKKYYYSELRAFEFITNNC